MYNSNKSFSTLSLVLVFVLIAFNSAKGIDLPFNPSNYHFLVYDPGAGSNIKEAMNILGISYYLRDKDHPVDANDLQTYAILIVGWNEGASSMGGLDTGNNRGQSPILRYTTCCHADYSYGRGLWLTAKG